MKTSSIFIKSWRGDREWLSYCLRSLAKFAHGFTETVVLIAELDKPHFEGFDFHGARVVWVDEPDDGRGYIRQQVFKLHADEYTEAQCIFYVDSDCFLFQEMTPDMFIPNGKPIALIRHWEDAGSANAWKPVMQKFLAFEPCFESMCALPFIIDRRVLPLLRDYAKSTHGCTIDEYALSQPGNEFSEFNIASAFAQRFTPYLYDFRIADPERDGFPRVLMQKWSWDKTGVSRYADEYEGILAR
jgi:Family of unknown function (DUF6492)